jgi:hypothetical protein
LSNEILAEGEIRYNLDTKAVHVGDGSKPGGDKFATDAQLASKLAEAKALSAELLAQVSSQVLAATLQAERAEDAVFALEVTTAGAWFPSLTDPELLELPNGEGAFVRTAEGRFLLVEMEAGAPVIKVEFSTFFSQRHNGINLWDYAKGDGVTDDTAAVNLAFALAVGMGVGKINCGGPGLTYLLGGPFVTLGTFPTPGGGTVPFNRHKVRLYANLHIVGEGATFKLAGGSTYPGGIFGHPWWDGERLENVKIKGIIMDGNMANQIVPPIPANGGGGGGVSVWQHGNAITGCFDGFEVDDCVFRDLRGHGINFNWASTQPDAWAAPRNVEVHHSEFVNVFTQACNAASQNTHFHHNRIHGDGFWVAGFDIESGSPLFPIRGVYSHDNEYDFRDGLAPPECVSQYASNSAEAMAGRRHLRRAVSAYCPGDTYTGTMRDVIIENELVYQGTLPLNRFGSVKIINPRIRNAAETLPDGYNSSATDAISLIGYGQVLPDCYVINPDIESALRGHGIFASTIDGLQVQGGSISGMSQSAMRTDACSGLVTDVKAKDFGFDDSGLAGDQIGTQSSALVIFGGQTDMLTVRNVTATDTRSGSARRVRHAVYGNVGFDPVTRVYDCFTQNTIGMPVRDVNNSMFKVGNSTSNGPVFNVSTSVAIGGTLDVSGGLIAVSSLTGTASLALNSAAGQQCKVVWSTGGSLEYTNVLEPGGQVNFTTYNNGAPVANALAIADDGHLVILNDWTHPMQVVGVGFRWMAANQIERVSGGAPTSDTDGVVVGTQI